MEALSIRKHIESFPQKRWLCHTVTLSLYHFAVTGERKIVSDQWALDFAIHLTEKLPRANKVSLPIKDIIPSNLYSIFAIKDDWCSAFAGMDVIAHSAILIETAPSPMIAEGGFLTYGIRIVPLNDFLDLETRKGGEIFEFTPEVLKKIYP